MTSLTPLSWLKHLTYEIISKRAFINLQMFHVDVDSSNSGSRKSVRDWHLSGNVMFRAKLWKVRWKLSHFTSLFENITKRTRQNTRPLTAFAKVIKVLFAWKNCLHRRRSVKPIIKVKYRLLFHRVTRYWTNENESYIILRRMWSSVNEIANQKLCLIFDTSTSGKSVCREGFTFANLDITISSHFLGVTGITYVIRD